MSLEKKRKKKGTPENLFPETLNLTNFDVLYEAKAALQLSKAFKYWKVHCMIILEAHRVLLPGATVLFQHRLLSFDDFVSS